MKARFHSKKAVAQPLDKDQSALVGHCVERNNRAYDILLMNPTYATLVAPLLIDASNRQFKDIPLFTYLLWTGDKQWINLFISEDANVDPDVRFNIYENLEKQLNDFKKSGVGFSIDGKHFDKQSQYSDKAHIDALKQYVDQYPNLTEAERQHLWIHVVGKQQRMVEKHIALALCHINHTPSHRLSIFSAGDKVEKPIWFPLSDSKLGKDYAICFDKVATACQAPNPAVVKSMIMRLEEIEQSKKNDLTQIEQTLKTLKNEVKDIIVKNQLSKGI